MFASSHRESSVRELESVRSAARGARSGRGKNTTAEYITPMHATDAPEESATYRVDEYIDAERVEGLLPTNMRYSTRRPTRWIL